MKSLSQDDVGTVGHIEVQRWGELQSYTVRTIMSITAPRGRMLLFSPLPDNRPDKNSQLEAIRAFMEEHRND